MSRLRFSLMMIFTFLAAGCAIQPRPETTSVPVPSRLLSEEAAQGSPSPAPSQEDSIGAGAGDPAGEPVPPAEVADAREVPLPAFWTQLGDPTLRELIGEALRTNLDVRAAEARVREASASRQLAALDYFPTVTASSGYTRQRFSGASFPGFSESEELDLYQAGVDASWEIDLFGRIRRNVAGQSALQRAALEDVRDVEVLLVSEVGRTYYDLRGAQEQLVVAERNAENQRRTLRLTEDRLEGGRGTAFDTERARAQLSATLATIPELETRIAGAIFRMGVLLGRPAEPLLQRLAAPAEFPELPESPRVGAPERLVHQRPDVRSAERRLAAETAFVSSARADYLPRLTVGGSAGYTSSAFDAIGDSESSRFIIGPTLSWPLFDLGRVTARVDAAEARASEARSRYDQAVLLALEEAETAFVAYDRARRRLTHLLDAAEASERAADLARLRFDEGITDFLQVLDAERTMLEAQDELAQGRTNAVNAFVELYRALGGLWPLGESNEP